MLIERNNGLLSISDASSWASEYLSKPISQSNIGYLIQYAKINRFIKNGIVHIAIDELKSYYESSRIMNTAINKNLLSFANLRESDTTKHVHRLHPYKGKFIPQLVEYFLDSHTDELKQQVYFNRNDIILDPFCGSGTTLVQANELGINAIGVDVSEFNTLISNCKIQKIDFIELNKVVAHITKKLNEFITKTKIMEFENELLEKLNGFNTKYFSSFDYKVALKNKIINEKEFANQKNHEFLPIYNKLIKKYGITLYNSSDSTFLNKWFLPNVINELHFVNNMIEKVESNSLKSILQLILSRTMRSCRATTHSDLATLIEPINTTYYCAKHYKICKPLFSIGKWWITYSKDTIKRLEIFDNLRTDTKQICITGDSRSIDLSRYTKKQKIDGIFSSPPYVGLIDYHEQHAYAYDLFGFNRSDNSEIGPLSGGQKIDAQEKYIAGISEVLINSKQYMKKDYNVFLVANDKFKLYPEIAKRSGMKIVGKFDRPVINRTEKSKNPYDESIFHMVEGD